MAESCFALDCWKLEQWLQDFKGNIFEGNMVVWVRFFLVEKAEKILENLGLKIGYRKGFG